MTFGRDTIQPVIVRIKGVKADGDRVMIPSSNDYRSQKEKK